MKRKYILILMIGLLFGCSSKTGKVRNIDPDDIVYFKDDRTDICYAIIGSKQGDDWLNESTSIGFTIVPCEKVEKYLK